MFRTLAGLGQGQGAAHSSTGKCGHRGEHHSAVGELPTDAGGPKGGPGAGMGWGCPPADRGLVLV